MLSVQTCVSLSTPLVTRVVVTTQIKVNNFKGDNTTVSKCQVPTFAKRQFQTNRKDQYVVQQVFSQISSINAFHHSSTKALVL